MMHTEAAAVARLSTCNILQVRRRTPGRQDRADFGKEIDMPHRLAAAVVAAAAFALTVANAGAADEAAFDRVFPSVYTDLLFNSKTAFEGKRYDEAFPLMKKAACAGDKESQWMLGHMYLLGQGVTRDDFTGYAWLKVAAEFSSPEYRSTVEKIEHAIDAKQLPSVEAEARKFVDTYGLRATNMSCNRAASQHGHIMDRIVCTPRYDGQLAMLRQCAAETPAQTHADAGSPAK
jgi:Sel1 repeat-containing protein